MSMFREPPAHCLRLIDQLKAFRSIAYGETLAHYFK